MSKSLKNFITIREALSDFSPRQIRFLFLLQKYHTPMEYSPNSMAAAADLERRFGAFEAGLAARLREAELAAGGGGRLEYKWGARERALQQALEEKRQAVHSALLDSIDTPSAVKSLEQLIRATNTYMGAVPEATAGQTLLQGVARYYGRVMGCFGVPTAFGGGGGGSANTDGGAGASGATPLQLAGALSGFRDEIRALAVSAVKGGGHAGGGIPGGSAAAESVPRGGDAKEPRSAGGTAKEPVPAGGPAVAPDLAAQVLLACDALRDETLPLLGLRVEDRPSGVAQFALDDPKIVLAEVARRAEAAAAADAVRAAKAAARQAAAEEDAARAAVPPEDMFKPEHDALFGRPAGAFGPELDEGGVPVSDGGGEALSKNARKKLLKQREKQAKAHVAALGAQ
jgi:cysteinyl-tRNA synthetase